MPDGMFLYEAISCFTALGIITGIILYIKRSKDRFCVNANNLLKRVDRFALANNIDPDVSLDIVLDNPKEHYDDGKIVYQEYIGKELDKGYDLIRTKFKGGFKSPYHKHRTADEFFYVLNGQIRVTTKIGDSEEDVRILSAGEYYLMEHNLFHVFETLSNSDVITVALPPLLKS